MRACRRIAWYTTARFSEGEVAVRVDLRFGILGLAERGRCRNNSSCDCEVGVVLLMIFLDFCLRPAQRPRPLHDKPARIGKAWEEATIATWTTDMSHICPLCKPFT